MKILQNGGPAKEILSILLFIALLSRIRSTAANKLPSTKTVHSIKPTRTIPVNRSKEISNSNRVTDKEAENTFDELENGLQVANRTVHRIHSGTKLSSPLNNESNVFHESVKEASTVNSTISLKQQRHQIDCSQFVQKYKSKEYKVDDFCYSPNDSLKCYQDPIFCETYHLSGKRELKWPAYGEYSHLSHEHWVKVLQHGGVVFLYHPCANESSIVKLRTLAETCMLRYVLTPYHKLSQLKPLALVSWGCFLLMQDVDFPSCKRWIRSHAYKGPASHIHKNGTYEHQLVKAAKIITDIKDTFLCPDELQKASLLTVVPPISKQKHVTHEHVGEEIIMKRLAKAKYKIQTHPKAVEQLPVNKKKAFTAFGSLVFLFVLLMILLLYTKLWTPKLHSSKFRYEKLGDLDSECEEQYYETKFSLLKTSQDFISSFKRGKRERKRDTHCKVKLLAPISEEEYNTD